MLMHFRFGCGKEFAAFFHQQTTGNKQHTN
jgi:hypothetical protein